MNTTRIEIEELAPGETNRIAAAPTNSKVRTATSAPVGAHVPRPWRRTAAGIGLLAVLLVAGYAGYRWWDYTRTWVSTDNAYVSGHVHTISTRIAGNVSEVLVTDNQQVQTGAVLVRLDANDLKVQRDKAQAELALAESQLTQAHAQVSRDEALTHKAQLDFERADTLFRDSAGVISKQEFDTAKAAWDGASASLNAAKAQVIAAEAQVKVATAQLHEAQLQLGYTEILAPTAGRVGRKNIEVGNRVQPGQSLLAIVQPKAWVLANFKETQLSNLRPGQPVRLSVDSLPGREFTGRVESLAPASGAQFALLPPDNATGNFTKIVQRVPVKIVFDDASVGDFAERIVPGMSVEVKVRVRS